MDLAGNNRRILPNELEDVCQTLRDDDGYESDMLYLSNSDFQLVVVDSYLTKAGFECSYVNDLAEFDDLLCDDYLSDDSLLGFIAYDDHAFLSIRRSAPNDETSCFIQIDPLYNGLVKPVDLAELRNLIDITLPYL